MRKTYEGYIETLGENQILVYGSNMLGRNKRGIARFAMLNGAKPGHWDGICGNTYAIPVKGLKLTKLHRHVILPFVEDFIVFARLNPQYEFIIANVGVGDGCWKAYQMAPLFQDAPENVTFPKLWVQHCRKCGDTLKADDVLDGGWLHCPACGCEYDYVESEGAIFIRGGGM